MCTRTRTRYKYSVAKRVEVCRCDKISNVSRTAQFEKEHHNVRENYCFVLWLLLLLSEKEVIVILQMKVFSIPAVRISFFA